MYVDIFIRVKATAAYIQTSKYEHIYCLCDIYSPVPKILSCITN